MNVRLIIAILVLACLGDARADPTIHGPFFNPRTGDNQDGELSVLMKLLDIASSSQSGAPYAAFTTVTATMDGTANIAARKTRRRIGWINTSNETTYISTLSGVTGATGLTVPAGGTGGMNYTGALYVHSASGTARVDFGETFD